MPTTDKPNIALPSNRSRNLFYAAFIVINLILSCYYLDIWITPNTASRAVPVLTLHEDNTMVIDKYVHYAVDVSQVDGHYFSNKAPLSTFLVYPFYSLYKGIGLPNMKDSTLKKYPIYIYENNKANFDGRNQVLPVSTPVFIIGDILCGAIPFVIILLLSLFAIKKSSTAVSPVIIVMLTFYASFIFAYAGTYTSHILAGVLVLGAYILLKKKKYIYSGILLGIAVAAEYPVGVLIPVWALLIYLNENSKATLKEKFTKVLLFGLGTLPGLLIVLWFNYHLTGSFTKTSYSFEVNQHKEGAQDVGFYFPKISALWGMIFSTYRGILYYTPVLLLMLWYGVKYGYQNVFKKIADKTKWVKSFGENYLLLTVVAYLLLYSAYYQWDGGWSYGPRYLIPIVIIILYEGIVFIASKPFSAYVFYAIAAMGLVFSWLDKSTLIFELPNNPHTFGNPLLNSIIPDFFGHRFNTNTLPVFIFNSNPVMSIYLWPALFIGGLVILTIWYSKLYPARKNNKGLVLSVVPFLVAYMAILTIQCTGGKNNLLLDNSGIFGAWKYYDMADTYRSEAVQSKDPKRKVGYFSAAENEYKMVMHYFPSDADCNYFLALCYTGEGQQDSAIIAYKKVLELNPKYSKAAKNLGLIYAGRAKFDSAIHYFNVAYASDSNLAALVDIGAVYQQAGDFNKALQYDSLVLRKDPNNKSVLKNLSIMHNAMNGKKTGN